MTTDLNRTIRALGGQALTSELLGAGYSRQRLFAAELAGEILRPRKGHWLARGTDPEVVRAVRVGGRLGCVSVAVRAGLWVPTDASLHVELPRNAARPRSPDLQRLRLAEHPDAEVITHWTGPSGIRFPIAGLREALRTVVQCLPMEESFAVLESALHRGALSPSEVGQIAETLPVRQRALLSRASGRSESGLESMLRLLLDAAGIQYRQQVTLAEVGRVDFLIGDGLIVEVDGRRYHEDFHVDRVRDAAASVAGRHTLRFDYVQLRFQPEQVVAAITAAIRRGDHLRSPRCEGTDTTTRRDTPSCPSHRARSPS